jgi:hypothetical protein
MQINIIEHYKSTPVVTNTCYPVPPTYNSNRSKHKNDPKNVKLTLKLAKVIKKILGLLKMNNIGRLETI